MKKITKSILALAMLMVGATSVSAEKVYADLSQYGDKWDGTDVSFSWTATYGNQLAPVLTDIGLPKGDLSSWEKLVVVVDELTNCDFFRILVYSGEDANHSNTFKATKTGTNEFAFSGNVDFLNNVTKIVLSGSNWEDSKNSTWGGTPASFKVKEVYVERPDDPLALPKDNLTKAISLGKKQNSYAKTTDSWNNLLVAISDGEDELVNATATAESLAAAKKAIEDAIAGFEYEPGYIKLTKDMANTNVDYVLNESTGLPFGNGSVSKDIYADLSKYESLIVIVSDGKPRFCMNRQTASGQIGATKAESKMIDINTQGDYASFTWATEAYQTVDEKVYTINLQKIAEDWSGEVKLHCIKGWNYANVTVTDMLLYRAPKTATIGEAGYATFSSDKAVKFEGVEAYIGKVNGSSLTLTPVTWAPANTAVILKGAAGTYNFPVIEAELSVVNDLKISDGTVTGDKIYVLAKPESKEVGFYLLDSSKKVPAGKAYIQLPADAPALDFIGFGSETTGINDVRSKMADVRGDFFDLQGRKVANPTKGLYIVNGKKVMVK